MQIRNILTFTGALALACVFAADARAQGSAPQVMPPGAAGGQAEMQQKMAELEQIKGKLDDIRDQALKDPALQKKREALETALDAAMKAEDPDALKKKAEYEKLIEKLEAARENGNKDKLTELGPRLRELGQSLQATQQKVMQKEAVAEAVNEFQEAMIARMKKVNPKTEQMLDRAEAIAQELQAAMGGMRGMGN